MILLNTLLLVFILSTSAQKTENEEPEAAVKPAPEGGDTVNTRILGPGLGSLINTGLGFAEGLAHSIGVGNRPGSFGAFNQPHAINFDKPGAFSGGHKPGIESAFQPGFGNPNNFGGNFGPPGFGRPGGFGNGFNRPGSFHNGDNRPVEFGGNVNHLGSFNNGVNRPGGFGGVHQPGSFGSGFSRPGDFVGNINQPDSFNSVNKPGRFGSGPIHIGPGGFIDNPARPGGFGGHLNRPFGIGVSTPGSCPPVRPQCPGTVRIGPVKCIVDTDCSSAEKCCPDVCFDFSVCKKPIF